MRILLKLYRLTLIFSAILLVGLATTAPAVAAQRIVSLSPVTTEILFALGVSNNIVGVTRLCDYPEAAKHLHKVGDQHPEIEHIVNVSPDLVVGMANDVTYQISLRKLGIDTHIFQTPTSVDAVYEAIYRIGQMVDRDQEAHQIVDAMQTKIQSVATHTQGSDLPKVMVVVWSTPLISAGPDSFIGDMVRLAGGRNILPSSRLDYAELNAETILAENPDIIVFTDERLKRRALAQPYILQTNAAKNGRIVDIDSDLISRAGPRVAEAIEDLHRRFND